MRNVYGNYWIGTHEDCVGSWMAVVHACKYPCKGANDLDNVYVPMLDIDGRMDNEVLFWQFRECLLFMRANSGRDVLVHCNKGESRSPSVLMCWLAIEGVVPRGSFEEAYDSFVDMYEEYSPNLGIRLFLHAKWGELMGV